MTVGAGCLALALVVSTATITPREAELYRAAIYLEGELAACEARERGLLRRLKLRTPTVAASLADLPPPHEGGGSVLPWLLGAGALGLAGGIVIGILIAR